MITPIAISELTCSFGDTVAVEGVDLEVRSGRVVGLLGRNGAGKTTTLRCLLGLTQPDHGDALVFGHRYAELRGAAQRIGVSMGDVGAVPGATVKQDLHIAARMLGIDRKRCDEVLKLVDLDAPNRKVSDLSTGMRQRHGLAVALLSDPEVLVLDEPASGLDPDGIRWLRDTLRSLAAEGRTVLLSSHHLAEVAQTVDDVVILQRTLRYSGTLADLTAGDPQRLEDRFFELVGSTHDTGIAHEHR